MSNQKIPSKAPSEQLAERILQVLVDNRLVLANDAGKIAGSLANGKLRAEDWRLYIEKAIEEGGAR